MADLDRLQRWVQTVIMNVGGARAGVASDAARGVLAVEPEEVERIVTPSRTLTGLERLEIYHRAYYARLLECLREEFPVLCHAAGEEAFDQFALAYLQKYPSRSYTLNQLGAHFPRYLAESRPAGEGDADGVGWPDFLIDLATLEQTYAEVFDGPGVEGRRLLDPEQLLATPTERWPDARLVPVVCLRLLALRFPVHKYVAAVRKKKEPAFPEPAETYLAVTRRDYVVRRYELAHVPYVLLGALAAGQPVGEAVARAAEAAPDVEALAADLPQWFRNWTAEGFFQAVELPAL